MNLKHLHDIRKSSTIGLLMLIDVIWLIIHKMLYPIWFETVHSKCVLRYTVNGVNSGKTPVGFSANVEKIELIVFNLLLSF